MTNGIDGLTYINQTTLSHLSIETNKAVNFTEVRIEDVLDENQKIKVLYPSVLNILNQIYGFLQLIDLSCSSFSQTIKIGNSKSDFQITLNTLLELKMHFFSELNQVELNKIFEYGYKSLNNSNTSGFGIGLSKVYEVVKHLGGNIFIKSKPGIRTSIVLTLKSEKIKP